MGCDLIVHGDPQLSLINFATSDGRIMEIADQMTARGWISARTVTPKGLHLMLSPRHLDSVESFIADFAEAMDAAKTAAPSASTDGFYN